METVTVNLSGKVRRATWNGRRYLVAPATLLVEGVLNGSAGPLFYPRSEIARDPAAWNHVPLTSGHPEIDGEHVSARDPDVLGRIGIGFVFNARIDGEGRLVAEAWIDEQAARRIDPTLLDALSAGKPVEISTGLFTENHPAEKGATHNGAPYEQVATAYRPDHLAVLTREAGACSVRDGCGLNVNAGVGWAKRLLDWLTGNSFKDCPRDEKGHCKAGGGGDAAAAKAPAVGGGFDTGATAVSGDKKSDAATASAVELAQKAEASGSWKAHLQAARAHEEAAGSHGSSAEDRANVASYAGTRAIGKADFAQAQENAAELWKHVHAHADQAKWHTGEAERLRGQARKLKRAERTQNAEAGWTKRLLDWLTGTKSNQPPERAGVTEGPEVTTATMNQAATFDRKRALAYLTANCDCAKTPADRAAIEKLSDEALATLQTNAERSAKLVLIVNRLSRRPTHNAEGEGGDGEGEVGGVDVAALAEFLGIAEDPASDPVAFIDALKMKLDEVMAKLGGAASPVEEPLPEDVPVVSADYGDDEEEKRKKMMATNHGRRFGPPASRLTPEEQEDLAWARRMKQQEKAALVGRLTANVGDPRQRQRKAAMLTQKPLAELRELAELLPPPPEQDPYAAPVVNYFGAAGGAAHLAPPDDSDNTLPVYEADWESMASPRLRGKAQ